jgi:hypothetical protein
MEWRCPLAILLHLLDLVPNHNGLIDHVLEIGVIGVEQLELNITIQEHVLFFSSVLMSSGEYLDN